MQLTSAGLYRPHHERDGCGFGLIVDLQGRATGSLVKDALVALGRLTHRGAISADGKSGDGCGISIGQPTAYLRSAAVESGIALRSLFAAGHVFLHQDEAICADSRRRFEQAIADSGLEFAGWRRAPVDPSVCGEMALASMPLIEQAFVNAPVGLGDIAFERRLYLARKRAERVIYPDDDTFYVTSLSARNVLFKGMVMPQYLGDFYLDLKHPEMASNVAFFHQRFSTNTLPQWWLAQPFRLLAHNGEINTLRGNRNWALARGGELQPQDFPEWRELLPMVEPTGSDSSSLDNMVEALVAGGLDVLHAIRILMPPAWEARDIQDPDVNAFYEYYGLHMEPWDGPAGVVLNDGRHAVCALDRNGLRPARYWETAGGRLTICSEAGVNDEPASTIISKGKLGPGDVLAIDLRSGKIMHGLEVDDRLKATAPYRRWLREGVRYMDQALFDPRLAATPLEPAELATFEKLFNITTEERTEVLRPLAISEMEAIGSMGDDAPIAILSHRVRPLYDSFRQMFAQVTNPPIDPLREKLVMSLQTRLGRKSNVFAPTADRAHHVVLNSPVLSQSKLRQLLAHDDVSHQFIDLNVPGSWSLTRALDHLCQRAEAAVEEDKLVLMLSDRYPRQGRVPVHALLATGAIHHHLVDRGLRCRCNLIVETGTARDPHHFACLIGYGATAVYPFMAYQCLFDMTRTGELHGEARWRELGRSYRRGIRKGLLKILSKMGISTIASYRGAQLFEIIGLNAEVVDRCFAGTDSRLGGKGFGRLEDEQQALAKRAFDPNVGREHGGEYRYRPDSEYHMYNPEVVRTLQAAAATGDPAHYREFAAAVNNRPVSALRDMLALKPREPIALEEVEPIKNILPRFECAGMSLGALSHEAHEAIAVAMNTLGGRSNSGEGGEDPSRNGTLKASKIRQVASGRFGVTPGYLVQAEAIQIKIAQGAKPGEGGQLPGHKVDARIATLRYSRPGVGLISPPPHHDIYSIEDLAQLIFDLKQVNPDALISVKLVAEPGVGTIAAGVAKAYADMITISGHDGGTGASPLTSVKYAGSPWEMGLSETQQVLRRNGLRGRVRVQTDGGLKTGLDVIKAAALGAETYGFGTAPLIALGCKYLRICHLNNCATGVATQNEVLRARFYKGKPDLVINYFRGVAGEVREWLAQLGCRSLEEVVGRTELLEPRDDLTTDLDLSPLLWQEPADQGPRYCVESSNVPFDRSELAEQMVAQMRTAIDEDGGGAFAYEVSNFHRSIGARLSGLIARRHGDRGLAKPIDLNLTGTAGQSLGAWNAPGLRIDLVGEANDYVGKGMAGGRIVLRPPPDAAFVAHESPIMGKTCLYGATGGELYAAGKAGERFAVRNSGVIAVVEGVGDHCCEYMTNGIVVVLGRTGVNFGAGMTGGFAYVLDEKRDFVDRYNHELIDIHRISREYMEAHAQHLQRLIEEFVRQTQSRRGEEILADFRRYLAHFWIVKPKASDLDALVESLQGAA